MDIAIPDPWKGNKQLSKEKRQTSKKKNTPITQPILYDPLSKNILDFMHSPEKEHDML